jgi:ABC-type lipoprotein release transport system permease subunit
MFFRKKGTASAILAIALLIALITSVSCLLNNINQQTTQLSKLPSIGQTYLITSKNSTSLADSQIDPSLISQIDNNSNIDYATSQQIVPATLTTNNGNFTVNIRAVDNMQAFLNNRQAYVNGSISKKESETDVGIILSQLGAIKINDSINLIINDKINQLKVVGIVQTTQQSDTEVIMPLTTLQTLTQKNGAGSFIEFHLNYNSDNKTIDNIIQSMPNNIKIIKIQQITDFIQDVNNQTISFINIWSIVVYTVVVAASYVVASRLVTEAEYELYMLKALGAKKKATTSLILTYTLTIAFFGAILGVAIGIVGTQMAATGVRLFWGNFQLAPFLQPEQALQITLIALVSAVIGSIYPAIKATQTATREKLS